MTNRSGKFMTVSHAADTANTDDTFKDPTRKIIPLIPEVPSANVNDTKVADKDYMVMVRRYFGQLWWLWLVVILLWLNKK